MVYRMGADATPALNVIISHAWWIDTFWKRTLVKTLKIYPYAVPLPYTHPMYNVL